MSTDVQSITASVRSSASTTVKGRFSATFFHQTLPVFPFLVGVEYRPRTSFTWIGLFVVLMQFLGFVFNLHLKHGETISAVSNIFYAFQLPLFDDTFLGGGTGTGNALRTTISSRGYAALFYIAVAIPILLCGFIGWFLLSGLPVRRHAWYFTVVKYCLHALSSVLFIPFFQSYLSMMVCIGEHTEAGDAGVEATAVRLASSSRLWLFPQQQCYGSFFWAAFVMGIIGSVCLGAVSLMTVLFLYDSDPLSRAVKGRNSSVFDVIVLIFKALTCILFHVFVSQPTIKHYFPMYLLFASTLMLCLTAALVPYYSHKVNRQHGAGLVIVMLASFLTFFSDISTDNGALRLGGSAAGVSASSAFSPQDAAAIVGSATTDGKPDANAAMDWLHSSSALFFGPYASGMTYSSSPYPFAVNFFASMDLDALLFIVMLIPLFFFGRWFADVRVNMQLLASLPALLNCKIEFIHPNILFPSGLPFRDLDLPAHREICIDVADRAQEMMADMLLQREYSGDSHLPGGGGGGMGGGGGGGGGGNTTDSSGGEDDDENGAGRSRLSNADRLFGQLLDDEDTYRISRGNPLGGRDPFRRADGGDRKGDADGENGGMGMNLTGKKNVRFHTNFASNDDPNYKAQRDLKRRRDAANANSRPLLLTPFLTVIWLLADVEASTRFLRIYFRITGAWPSPHMLLLATRIFTKGMTKYRGNSRLLCTFAQFSAAFVGKASLALAQLEKVHRLDASLTTRFRAYKLQSALKSEINIRESAYQQQVDAAKKLHKETLMHIEAFWGKILQSGRGGGGMGSFGSSSIRRGLGRGASGAKSSSSSGNNNNSSNNNSSNSKGNHRIHRGDGNTGSTAVSGGGEPAVDISQLATVASLISTRRVACKASFLHALAHGSNDRILLAKYADFVDNVMFDPEGADHLRQLTEHEAEERKMKVMRGASGGGGGGGGGGLGSASAVFSQAITDVLSAHESAAPGITITAHYQQQGLWATIALIVALLAGFLVFAFITNSNRVTAINCAQDVGTVRSLVVGGGMLGLQHMLGVPTSNAQDRLKAIEDTVTDIITYQNRLIYGPERSALGDFISDPNLVNLRYITPNVSAFSMSSLLSIGYDPAYQLQSAVRLASVAARDATTGAIISQQREAIKKTLLESYERWYPAALTRAAVMCDQRLQSVDETSIIVLTVLFVVALLLILTYAVIVALNAAHADQFRASVLSLFPLIPRDLTKQLHDHAAKRVIGYDRRDEEDGVEHLALGSQHGTNQLVLSGGGGGSSGQSGGSNIGNGGDLLGSRRLSGSAMLLKGSFNGAVQQSSEGDSSDSDSDASSSGGGGKGDNGQRRRLLGGASSSSGSPQFVEGRLSRTNSGGFRKGPVGGIVTIGAGPSGGGGGVVSAVLGSGDGDDGGGVHSGGPSDERRSLLSGGSQGGSGSGGKSGGGDGDGDRSRRGGILGVLHSSFASTDSGDESNSSDSLFEKVAVAITMRQFVCLVFITVASIALFVISIICATRHAGALSTIMSLRDAAAAIFPTFVVARSVRFSVAHYSAFAVSAYASEAQSYIETLFNQLSSVSSLTLPPAAVDALLVVIRSVTDLAAECTSLIRSVAPFESSSDSDFARWNQTLSTSKTFTKQLKRTFAYDETIMTQFRTVLNHLRQLCSVLADEVNVNVTTERVLTAVSIAIAVLFVVAAVAVARSLRSNRALFFTTSFKALFSVIIVGILVGFSADIAALVELGRFERNTEKMMRHIKLRYDSAIAISNTLLLARCFIVAEDELAFKYYEDAIDAGDGVNVLGLLSPTNAEIEEFVATAERRRAMEGIVIRLALPSFKKKIPDAIGLYSNVSWDFDAEPYARQYRQLHPYDTTLYSTSAIDTRRHPNEQRFLATHLLFSPRYKSLSDMNSNLVLRVYERTLNELASKVRRAGNSAVIASSISAGFKGLSLVLLIVGLAMGIQTYVTNLSRTNRAAASATAKGSAAYSSVVSDRNRRATLLVRISMLFMFVTFVVLYIVGYLNITTHRNSARVIEAGTARELIFGQTMIVAEKLAFGHISNATAASRIDSLLEDLAVKRQFILTTDNIVGGDEHQMDFIYGYKQPIPAAISCGFLPNGSLTMEEVLTTGSNTVVMGWKRTLQSLTTAVDSRARVLIMEQLRARVMPSLRAMRYSSDLLADRVLGEVDRSHWAFVGIVIALIALMFLMAVFVIRPLVAAYTEDIGGSKLLLKLIPQHVRDEIPAISEFMEMDLQEGMYGGSGGNMGFFGGLSGGGGDGTGGLGGGAGGNSKSSDSLAEPSNVPVIAIDALGVVLKYNAACEGVFGFSAAEVVGNNVSILMPDRIAQRHDFYLAKYRVTGQRRMIGFERHVHARHQLGHLFPIELNVKEYRRSNGETVYFGFVRTIAKKLELRATDELNNLILEFAPLPMCAIDALGTVIRFNKAAEMCFGHSASDVIQQNVKMLMPEEFAARHDSYLATYLRTHEKHVIDSTRRVTGLRKSGDVFPMDISVKEVKASEFDDGMSTFLGYIRDVTADIQLHSASFITEAVANLAPLPVIGINAFGKVLKFNTAASRLFGYEPNKVIGQNVKMLMPDHIASEHDRYLEEYANTGKKRLLGAERIMEGKKADGSIFPIKGLIREIKGSKSAGGGANNAGAGGGNRGAGNLMRASDTLDGGISTFIGYIVDLSHERHQNDQKVLGDAIVDTHPVALLTLDSRGILTRVNRALCFEFGYNERDILGKSVQTLLPFAFKPGDDVTDSISWLTQAVRRIQGRRKSGELLQLEVTLEEVTDIDILNTAGRALGAGTANIGGALAAANAVPAMGGGGGGFNGNRRLASFSAVANSPFFDNSGDRRVSSLGAGGGGGGGGESAFDRAKSYVGYLRNITTEVALESRQAINIACLDISPVPIVVSDAQGMIVQFSIAAQKLWKYNVDEVLGKNVSMLMPEHIRIHHDDFIARYNRTGVKRMIDNVTITEGQDRFGNSFPLEVCIKDITRPSKADPFRQLLASAAGGTSSRQHQHKRQRIGDQFGVVTTGGSGGQFAGTITANTGGFGSYPSPDSDEEDNMNNNDSRGGRFGSPVGGGGGASSSGGGTAVADPKHADSIAQQNAVSAHEYTLQTRYFIAYMRNASRDGEAQEIIERNALISELSPVPLVQIDLYGTILMFNKAAEEEFGWLRNELIGKNVRIIIPEDIAKHHDQYMANYRKTHQKKIIGSLTRTKARRKSGEHFAVELMVDEVVVEGDPDQNTYIGYIRNVTDEQRLTKANQLSGVVSELSPTPLVAINSKGIVVNFNEAACRTFKYSAHQVINHNVKMLMPPEVAAAHDGYLTAYAKTGEKHIVDATREVTARRSDGTLFQVELAVKEIKHPGQEESTFLSYIRDLTFNMQIAHTKRITDVVQSLSTVPMVIIDQWGIIQDVNRATPPMFGYMDEMELIGANVKILMTKDLADQHDMFIAKYLKTKVKHVIDTTRPVIALRKDGTTFTAELSVRELDVPEDFANMRGTRTDSRSLSTNDNSQYYYSSSSTTTGGVGGGGSSGGGSGYGGGSSMGSSGYLSRKFFIAYLRNMDELREMERNLNINTAITKGSAVPLIIIDKRGAIKQFVPAAEQFFGYTEEAMIGKNVKMLMPDDIASNHDRYLEEYDKTRVKKVVGTTRLVHAKKANGSIVPVSITIRELPSNKVGEVDFIGYVVDQSKEHAVEMALATTVAVREMLPVAIISINDKGIVREFNLEAEKFFGYERKEIVGQNVNMLMTHDVARVHDAYLEAYRRTLVRHIIGSTRSVMGRHKDGTELFIELQVSEFIVDQQRCFVGFANDRRASMELEQSNRINNAMISLSIHPIITIDSLNNINHFNPAAEKQFGFSFDEVFGQNVKLLMPNEVAVHHDGFIARYKATNQSRVINQTRHVTAQRKNGDKFRAEITVKKIDHEGQMLFVAYCRDISKELEARSNAIFASAISALMPDPFVAINGEGIVLVFSQAACNLFEYQQSDVVGCNVSMLMPPDIAAQHNGFLKRYAQTREKHIIGKKRRVVAKTKSGKLIDVELHINEKIIEGKRFYFGYVRDATRDFELALQTEIGEALVETNPDAIITIDTSGTITRFNATAENLFQFDRHLVIGKNVNILMPAITARRHDQYLSNYLRTGNKRIVDAQNAREVTAEKKNGDTFPAYLSVRQLLDTDNRPSMFIGFIRPK